jgi:hypothetical protein
MRMMSGGTWAPVKRTAIVAHSLFRCGSQREIIPRTSRICMHTALSGNAAQATRLVSSGTGALRDAGGDIVQLFNRHNHRVQTLLMTRGSYPEGPQLSSKMAPLMRCVASSPAASVLGLSLFPPLAHRLWPLLTPIRYTLYRKGYSPQGPGVPRLPHAARARPCPPQTRCAPRPTPGGSRPPPPAWRPRLA